MPLAARLGLTANLLVSSAITLSHLFLPSAGVASLIAGAGPESADLLRYAAATVGAAHVLNASLSLYALREKSPQRPLARAVVHSQVLMWVAAVFVQLTRPIRDTQHAAAMVGICGGLAVLSCVATFHLAKLAPGANNKKAE